jgi:hypothetical protein
MTREGGSPQGGLVKEGLLDCLRKERKVKISKVYVEIIGK